MWNAFVKKKLCFVSLNNKLLNCVKWGDRGVFIKVFFIHIHVKKMHRIYT